MNNYLVEEKTELPQLKLLVPIIMISILLMLYVITICYVRTKKYHKLSSIKKQEVDEFIEKNSLSDIN